jgi:hypothetical protein
MILTAAFSVSPDCPAWLAAPLGGEGVLGAALTDISAIAIASGVLVGVLSLLAGLRWGGRRPLPVPVRAGNGRRRERRPTRR